MISVHKPATAGFFSALASCLVLSTIVPIAHAQLVSEFSLGRQDFQFDETDTDGSSFVAEEGELTTLGMDLRWQRGDWLLEGGYQRSQGDADYSADGVESTTDHTVDHYRMEIGRQWRRRESAVAGFLGYGERHWQRDINGTGRLYGLDENYDWPYLSAHAQLAWSTALGAWALNVYWRHIDDASMRVDFRSGQFDPATIDMGRGDSLGLAQSWRASCKEISWCAGVELYADYWAFDRSAPRQLRSAGEPLNASAAQPENETLEVGLRVLIRYGFGD